MWQVAEHSLKRVDPLTDGFGRINIEGRAKALGELRERHSFAMERRDRTGGGSDSLSLTKDETGRAAPQLQISRLQLAFPGLPLTLIATTV
jgi:hypothetical protein